jgi:hypothetical protein
MQIRTSIKLSIQRVNHHQKLCGIRSNVNTIDSLTKTMAVADRERFQKESFNPWMICSKVMNSMC